MSKSRFMSSFTGFDVETFLFNFFEDIHFLARRSQSQGRNVKVAVFMPLTRPTCRADR